MPVSRKSKKNLSKKRKTSKHIRKMKGGVNMFIINQHHNTYDSVQGNDIKKTFLDLFKPYDPINPNDNINSDNFVASTKPATQIRIFDTFNRLLGEVSRDKLTELSYYIRRSMHINLINPELTNLHLCNNNIKQLTFEITY
jgi:hypothetical protein